jgi:hypothetical protein
MTDPDTQKAREEYAALQAQLATRRSIRHFAHAAISLLVSFTALATAAKLHLDYHYEFPQYAYAALGFAALLALYGAVCAVLGFVAHRKERAQFRLLQELRRALRLDDPSELLPR